MDAAIDLPDLVMLQMMGRLDDYLDEMGDDTATEEILREARETSSTPDVFDEIVRKTEETQFGNRYAFVRELAQNAKDAYPRHSRERAVRFETDYRPREAELTVRDHGAGMEPDELVQNLLIPYNSGKGLDPEVIGEHGIGWYSVLDLAERVEITSGRDGTVTHATVTEEDGWTAEITTEDGAFDGTRIRMEAPRHELDTDAIYDELRTHVGHADPEGVTIALNGEQVNTLQEEYDLVGREPVEAEGLVDDLELYVKEDARAGRGITLTQDGLYIKEEINPFTFGSPQYEMLNALQETGRSFRFDLPNTVGLTKGRNEIVASDRTEAYAAMEPAFEQYVLETVLGDEDTVRELDMRVTDWIEDMFEETYVREQRNDYLEAISPHNLVTGVLGAAEKAYGTARLMYEHGTDAFTLAAATSAAQGQDDPETEEERTMEYYRELNDFSEQLLEKPFIPAERYEDGSAEELRVSMHDMIAAHARDDLYDMAREPDEDGLYVDLTLPVASMVRRKLREMDRKAAEEAGVPDIITAGRRIGRKLYGAFRNIEMPERRTINHVQPETVDTITAETGMGEEYRHLLAVGNELDDLIAEATSLNPVPVMLHYDEHGEEIAHTNGHAISFNLAQYTTDALLDAARDGEYTRSDIETYMDILLHEKAHATQDERSCAGKHGTSFYDTKRHLRDQTLAYLQEEEIDPVERVNADLTGVEEPTDPLTFGEQLEEYDTGLFR